MDKFKGSPGPWRFSTSDGFSITTSPVGILEGSKEVCKISEFNKEIGEIQANGRLMARSPELLAMVQDHRKRLSELTTLLDSQYILWSHHRQMLYDFCDESEELIAKCLKTTHP